MKTTDELIALIRKYPEWLDIDPPRNNGWVQCPVCGAQGCKRPGSTVPPKHEPDCPRARLQESQ